MSSNESMKSCQSRVDQVQTNLDGDTSKHTVDIKPDSLGQTGAASPNSSDRGKGGK